MSDHLDQPPDDLFGDVWPSGYTPGQEPEKVENGFGAPGFGEEQKDKRTWQKSKHAERARAELLKLHPGALLWKADYDKFIRTGPRADDYVVIKQDTLGLFDIMGLTTDGRVIGCQFTTKASMSRHLSEYVDPKTTHGSGKVPVEKYLREFLANGGTFYLLGFEKGARFWDVFRTTVTIEKVDEAKARKRGPKAMQTPKGRRAA